MPLASMIGRWAMQPFSKALPPLGDTERAAEFMRLVRATRKG